jgi:hypothetical protein
VTRQIYPVSYLQLQGITEFISSLNIVDSDDATPLDEAKSFGDGYYATLAPSIPIYTDSYEVSPRELLGWVVRGDFGWNFTQNPKEAGEDPVDYSIGKS